MPELSCRVCKSEVGTGGGEPNSREREKYARSSTKKTHFKSCQPELAPGSCVSVRPSHLPAAFKNNHGGLLVQGIRALAAVTKCQEPLSLFPTAGG